AVGPPRFTVYNEEKMTTVDLKIINGQVLNVFSQAFEPETLMSVGNLWRMLNLQKLLSPNDIMIWEMASASAETIVTQTKVLQTSLAAISDVSFDIFQTLSFMALPVIPCLKITNQGLFDFEKWDFIDINAD
ncbi:adenine deaminase C-terminal domain-containing protein, partial [Weissella cibaria]|uniref:adenine deaminase C-terminal domain-containing protein n=1 Tax=Weissella cibaria TaxID=137591 RepID=UPI002468270F